MRSPMQPSVDMTPFEAVNYFFHRAAAIEGLGDTAIDVLSGTFRELRVQVPFKRDDGSMEVVYGYRVQHNGHAAPTRAASASTRTPTSMRSVRWPR